MLAEDNYGDIALIQQALRQHHIEHSLQVARDGGEAIELLSRMGASGGMPCPDLVLLDLNLPKADGAQVLAALRQRSECAHTPVIVVTSSDAPKDRRRIADLGVNRYFKKPSDLDEYMKLGATVLEVIAARRSDAPGAPPSAH